MAHVLILGAGFGGITLAREVRARLPASHRITLVEQRDTFLMGLAKLWALDGRRPLAAGRREYSKFHAPGVDLTRGRVEAIDVGSKTVEVDGKRLTYDVLVLALGAELAPDAVPGFEAAHNLYDPEGAERVGQALRTFSGGRVLVFVSSIPFKCPPGPYEAAMLMAAALEKRGVRSRVEIEVTTPEPRPLPIAPAATSAQFLAELTKRGIRTAFEHKPRAVRSAEHVVEYENGVRKNYDLLVGVPAHRAPPVVREARLTDASGFVPVDPRTLATAQEGVFAIGDVAFIKTPSGKPLPKAGVLAEAQARVVAANVAETLQGRPATFSFEGQGHCYAEVGQGLALAVEGAFYEAPEARVELRGPNADALREKERFEADRLASWFGS